MKYLVFDVGGSAIKYAVMDEKADFFEKGQVPTPLDTIENFLETIGSIFDRYKDSIEGIAFSMPGRINSDSGYAYTGGSLKYNTDKDMVSLLKERCPMPITIENDGKCAALAEVWMGSLSDCNDGIVVVLGTGIGGGIIKDRKLHRGRHFQAGEFSSISMYSEDQISNLWALQSGSIGLREPVANIKKLPVEEVDGRKVFEFANQGDEEVLQILDDYCYKIVVQLFNLHFIYDPERIAIGGGISAQDILFEYIQKNVEKYAALIPQGFVKPEIVRCKFGNDSNLIGALYHFLTKNG